MARREESMIAITRDNFDIGERIAAVRSPAMGAVVTFVGTVRDDGIEALELEAFEEVALADLHRIRTDATERFGLTAVEIIHRTGRLAVGENILLIVVGAGHRQEAFAGCEYILERIKERVPIWKKETGPGGEQWVPGHVPES
jgi:molybdopterin synthase catalytic subunit